MASIKKRPDGQWRVRYRDDAGKEHARHFGRKVDAQRWLDEVTASMVTGAYVDPKVADRRGPHPDSRRGDARGRARRGCCGLCAD